MTKLIDLHWNRSIITYPWFHGKLCINWSMNLKFITKNYPKINQLINQWIKNNKSNKCLSLAGFISISVSHQLERSATVALPFSGGCVLLQGKVGEWAVEALVWRVIPNWSSWANVSYGSGWSTSGSWSWAWLGIFPPNWSQILAVTICALTVLPCVSNWTSAALSVNQIITWWADAVNTTPDEWRITETSLSLFVPMFLRWALNTVWSEETW